MNEITILNKQTLFDNEFIIFGTPDEPLFLATDVAKMIEHSNVSEMLKVVDDSEKLTSTMFRAGQLRSVNMLTEDGLYEVLMQSRKPIAKQFKKRVKEILKEIRKTGGYKLPKSYTEALECLLATEKEKERLSLENEEMKPKAFFADAVRNSKSSISMGEMAKLLEQNGVKIGRNRLFTYMRDNGYILKNSTEPTQRAMELGLFEMNEVVIDDGHNGSILKFTTKVTGKGQNYFINHLADECIKREI